MFATIIEVGDGYMAYKKVIMSEAAKTPTNPWLPVKLGGVDEYDVKVVIYEGEYPRHKHIFHDEFIYVFKGQITEEFDDGIIVLNEGEGVFIERGTVHKAKCNGRAVVLLFERKTFVNDTS